MDGNSRRLTLDDVLSMTFKAQADANFDEVFALIDEFAGASTEFHSSVTKDDAAKSNVNHFARAVSVAAWLTGAQINPGLATQLFFRLANAVGHVVETTKIDDATVTAQISLQAEGRPISVAFELALFAALSLR